MRLRSRIERLEKSRILRTERKRKAFFVIVETREQLVSLLSVTRADLRKLKTEDIERRGGDTFVKASALIDSLRRQSGN